jgi:uncharacterized protein YbjT (DUF2867 family)
MSVLVTGGTGTVGSAVVKELVGRSVNVSVLTRDPAKLKDVKGVTPVQGDLLELATVRRAFDGADAVFLLDPVSQTETSEGLTAVAVPARVDGVRLPLHIRALPAAGAHRERRGDRAADAVDRPRAALLRRLREGDGGCLALTPTDGKV